MEEDDVIIDWNEGMPAMHGSYWCMPFVKRRSGDDATRYVARGLADLARRSHRFSDHVAVFMWQHRQDWVCRVDLVLVDVERDRVQLTVREDGAATQVHEWMVPAKGPYEPVAREIAALLPAPTRVPELLVGSSQRGMPFTDAIAAARRWGRLLVVNLIEFAAGAVIAALGALAGLVAVFFLVSGGLPGALLGLLSVPVGWAFGPLLITSAMMVRDLAPPSSRAKRLRERVSGRVGPVTESTQTPKLLIALFVLGGAVVLAGMAGIPFLVVFALGRYFASAS